MGIHIPIYTSPYRYAAASRWSQHELLSPKTTHLGAGSINDEDVASGAAQISAEVEVHDVSLSPL